MNKMFKDWDFWRPILKFVSVGTVYFSLLYYLPAKYSAIFASGIAIIAAFYLFYMVGKANYDYKQFQMKNNYKKLTGKEMDE